MIQDTRRASRYGGWLMTWATRRSKGAMPVVASQRPKDFGAMDVQSGQIGPSATARVFVLDTGCAAPPHGQRGVTADPGLDARLLIGAEHKVPGLQRLAFPAPGVQIQDPSRLGSKIRIVRKDPAAVLPRTNGVLMQPAPDRLAADGRHDAAAADLARDKRDNGTPKRAGSSPPSARTWTMTSGEKIPGPSGTWTLVQPR